MILHITHNDADALGCALVLDFFSKDEMSPSFTNEEIKHYFCAIGKQDETLLNALDEYQNDIHEIIISDISISKETVSKVMEFLENHHHVTLRNYDHHNTNPNKDEEWCFVREEVGGHKISACKIMFNIFNMVYKVSPIDMRRFESYVSLLYIVERISAYDTWEWKNNPYKYVVPDINDTEIKIEEDFTTVLIQMLGIESTYELFKNRAYTNIPYETKGLMDPVELYGKELTSLYFAKKRKDKEDVDNALKNVRVIRNCDEFNNLNIAIFIQDRGNPSIIGNRIVTEYPDIDLVVILFINSKTISLRSDESKVDCSTIAKERGGGGHPAAAGFKATDDTEIAKYINLYFSTKEYLIKEEN